MNDYKFLITLLHAHCSHYILIIRASSYLDAYDKAYNEVKRRIRQHFKEYKSISFSLQLMEEKDV